MWLHSAGLGMTGGRDLIVCMHQLVIDVAAGQPSALIIEMNMLDLARYVGHKGAQFSIMKHEWTRGNTACKSCF